MLLVKGHRLKVLRMFSFFFSIHFNFDNMKYLNNPANIRFSNINNWNGLIGSENGFCQFQNIEFGLRALVITLRTYIRKYGLINVSTIISRFAPCTENNTCAYIRFVRQYMVSRGYDASDIKFGTKQFACLCCAILWFESNFSCDIARICNIITMFNLK